MDRDCFVFDDFASAISERADGSCDLPGIQLDLSGLHGANLGVGGTFHIECIKPDSSTRWVDDAKNTLTNAALDDVLNVYLADQSPKATWYIGLVDNASFTAFAGTDVIGSHSGWIENTNWSGSTRPAWGNGTSSGGAGSVTNASTVNFSMTATVTIKGLFLVSDSTKGGTSTGLIFSTAAFTGGNQAVNNGDTLKVTYTVTSTTS